MHINLWGNGQSKAVGHGWHAAHREHSKDSAKALQQQATQDVVAALRKRLVSDSSAAQAAGSATDAPMQTLVTTVRSAMSLRVSGGGDPVPDVLDAVRGALGDARAALLKSGASEDDAGKAIAAVSEQLGAALSAAPPAAATNSTTAAAAAAAQAAAAPAATTTPATSSSESTLSVNAAASNFLLTYVRKQKASLDIQTQEGDQIHILFRSKEAVTASGSSVSNTTTAANQASSATSGTTTAGAANSNTAGSSAAGSSPASTSTNALPAGTSVHAFAAGRVEVSVQGQLSADELKAIGDLVGKVDALATEFFKGDLQQAFNSAAALGFDSSQIAGFALKLSQQESLRQSGAVPAAKPATSTPATTTASTSTTPVATTPAASPPVAAPVAAPVAEPAPVSTPASPVALDSAATLPAAAGASTDAATTSSTAPVPASSDAQAASLQDTLGSFLSKVLQTLAAPSGGGRLEFSMRWKLSLVVSAVESAAPKLAQGSDAGTSLLTRSLKAVGSLTAMSQAPASQAPISLAPVSAEPASA